MNLRMVLILFLAFGSTFLLPESSAGQKIQDLSVTGAVIKRTRIDSENEVKWAFEVQLTLLNKGSEPILVYNCFKYETCSRKITFLTDELHFDKAGTRVDEQPYFSWSTEAKMDSHWWNPVIRELKASSQPHESFIVIAPEIPYQTIVTFEIKQKFKLIDKEKVVAWENDRTSEDQKGSSIPIAKTSKLTIEYRFVPMEQESLDCESAYPRRDPASCLRPYRDANFLESLARRWRTSGILPLDSSGSFSLLTSPILNLEDHDPPPTGR